MKRSKQFKEIRKKYDIVFSKECQYYVIVSNERNWSLGGFATQKDANNKLDRIINDIINLKTHGCV